MNSSDAFTRAALYQSCSKSDILKHVDIENTDSETLRDLLNKYNLLSLRKLPIIMTKFVTKVGLEFVSNKFPKMGTLITPQNIKVDIEDDELIYLMNTSSNFKPNIVFLVCKNIAVSVLGASIDSFKNGLTGNKSNDTIIPEMYTKISVSSVRNNDDEKSKFNVNVPKNSFPTLSSSPPPQQPPPTPRSLSSMSVKSNDENDEKFKRSDSTLSVKSVGSSSRRRRFSRSNSISSQSSRLSVVESIGRSDGRGGGRKSSNNSTSSRHLKNRSNSERLSGEENRSNSVVSVKSSHSKKSFKELLHPTTSNTASSIHEKVSATIQTERKNNRDQRLKYFRQTHDNDNDYDDSSNSRRRLEMIERLLESNYTESQNQDDNERGGVSEIKSNNIVEYNNLSNNNNKHSELNNKTNAKDSELNKQVVVLDDYQLVPPETLSQVDDNITIIEDDEDDDDDNNVDDDNNAYGNSEDVESIISKENEMMVMMDEEKEVDPSSFIKPDNLKKATLRTNTIDFTDLVSAVVPALLNEPTGNSHNSDNSKSNVNHHHFTFDDDDDD